MLKRAQSFARRVEARTGMTRERQIAAAFGMALGREPEESELRSALKFFGDAGGSTKLIQFCHALLNANEFVYLE